MTTLLTHYGSVGSASPAWIREAVRIESEADLMGMSVGGAPAGAALIEEPRLHHNDSAGPAEHVLYFVAGHLDNAAPAGVMAAAATSPPCEAAAGPSKGVL